MSLSPEEKALKRIEECRRTRAEVLDLSCLGLTEIPEEVFELAWLQKLDLSRGKGGNIKHTFGSFSQIPAAIEQLTELVELGFSFNPLLNLENLKHLPKLLSLNCGYSSLIDLSILQYLTLSDWSDADKFWESVQIGIRKQVERLIGSRE